MFTPLFLQQNQNENLKCECSQNAMMAWCVTCSFMKPIEPPKSATALFVLFYIAYTYVVFFSVKQSKIYYSISTKLYTNMAATFLLYSTSQVTNENAPMRYKFGLVHSKALLMNGYYIIMEVLLYIHVCH